MRKTISVKIQGWIFVILAFKWLLSITLLLSFGHWVWGIVVICVPFAIEYAARCYKAKKVLIPYKAKITAILAKITANHRKSPQITEQGNPLGNPLPCNLITSISILTFAQFVRCYAYDELNILDLYTGAEGTRQGQHGEIKQAWDNLYSQYLAAIKDPNISHRFKVQGKIKAYETRAAAIETNCNILLQRYSPAAIKLLQYFYPKLQFLPETIEKDVKYVRTGEIKYKMDNSIVEKELAEMNKGNNKVLSPEEKEEDLINMLLEINKHEGIAYNQKEITVLMFAKAQNRLMKHIENLKQQQHGSR